jgi:hypothetical protein
VSGLIRNPRRHVDAEPYAPEGDWNLVLAGSSSARIVHVPTIFLDARMVNE